MKPQQFDATDGRVIKHPNVLVLNATIIDAFNKEKKLNMALMKGKPIDPADIIATTVATLNQDAYLLFHGNRYVERCRQKGQFHTAEKYGGHLTKLAEYLGMNALGVQNEIHMDIVDEDLLLKWANWLRVNGTKSVYTLHRRIAFITTLYNDARKRRLTTGNPTAFLEFKEQKVRKLKLTPEQLAALESVPLTGRLDDARNTFLMQFFAYGTRISDALNWRKENIRKEGNTWYLEYTSMKSGDLIDVRLNPKAKEIVSRYLEKVPGLFLLPWLSGYEEVPKLTDQQNRERLIQQIESKTGMVNVALKEVAILAEIPVNLTTHVARHTFATLADSKISGKRKISAALGHSKLATTEVYLSELHQSDVNDAIEDVWK
ncbi:tyrosine-type recombinase/integrase [Spirosoma pulveris]